MENLLDKEYAVSIMARILIGNNHIISVCFFDISICLIFHIPYSQAVILYRVLVEVTASIIQGGFFTWGRYNTAPAV